MFRLIGLVYLCNMIRMTALLLLLTVTFLSSCTSEYEECLDEGLFLKEKLALMERSHALTEDDQYGQEIEEIRNQIDLLAKVSGNEELFLQQVYGDQTSNSWFGSQK